MPDVIERCIETLHRYIDLGVVCGSVPARHTVGASYTYKSVRRKPCPEDSPTFVSSIYMHSPS